MRSAAVFFTKRRAMRSSLAPRSADGKSRLEAGATLRGSRRASTTRDRATRPLTRSPDIRTYRPRRMRARLEVLVPRGFVPLRTH
jgi:hypothetical protein